MNEANHLASNTAATKSGPQVWIRISPSRGLLGINWSELWQYRDLLSILAIRDIRVRYKQTIIGAAWAVLQPLMTMVVFTVLFGMLLGRGNEPTVAGVPYPVSTFCALLPWQLFAHALAASSNSLVDNEKLVTKVYFPRLIIPAASVMSGLMDFCISLVILFCLMVFYGVTPGWGLVALPAFLILAILTALGMGLWLSALNAMYRDVRYTVPFIVQLGMFVTPVVYSAQNILPDLPAWAQTIYMLNPMAGVIEGFRWAMLGAPLPPIEWLGVSLLGVVLLFISGAMYFRRMERTFADWI